jgi:hypothetical protein
MLGFQELHLKIVFLMFFKEKEKKKIKNPNLLKETRRKSDLSLRSYDSVAGLSC